MIKRLTYILSLIVLCVFANPTTALAFDFFGHACNGDTSSSAACGDNSGTNPLTGDPGLIIKIADIIAYIAGAAAVIILLISGLRYITSGSDPEKAKTARKTATGALIGLAVIALAKVLIDFVLSKL